MVRCCAAGHPNSLLFAFDCSNQIDETSESGGSDASEVLSAKTPSCTLCRFLKILPGGSMISTRATLRSLVVAGSLLSLSMVPALAQTVQRGARAIYPVAHDVSPHKWDLARTA